MLELLVPVSSISFATVKPSAKVLLNDSAAMISRIRENVDAAQNRLQPVLPAEHTFRGTARLVIYSKHFRLENGLIAECRAGDPAERCEVFFLADDQIPLVVNLYAGRNPVAEFGIEWFPFSAIFTPLPIKCSALSAMNECDRAVWLPGQR